MYTKERPRVDSHVEESLNGTSIIMIIIIYEERWESIWEMSIQIVHKAIHSKQTGGYNDRGNITRGVARKAQMRR